MGAGYSAKRDIALNRDDVIVLDVIRHLGLDKKSLIWTAHAGDGVAITGAPPPADDPDDDAPGELDAKPEVTQ